MRKKRSDSKVESGSERMMHDGRVIWITGLSGSGKTTLAREVVSRLRERGEVVLFLDGDELRGAFGAEEYGVANHGRSGRLALAMRYSRFCRLAADQGLTVVIATISLFKEVHDWNRENLPGYLEVFLKVPVSELRRRDPKGIYRRFDQGEVSNVAGLDLEVDEPVDADLLFDYEKERDLSFCVKRVMEKLAKHESG